MKTCAIILLIASFIILPSLVQAELKPDKSLALWFRFDEGSGDVAKDSSGNKNDGKIKGGFKWGASKDASYKTALEFNGSDVDVRAPHINLQHQNHTIEMWVAPNLDSGQQLVFSQREQNTTNKSLHYRVYDDGRTRMGFYGNDLDTPAGMLKKGEWAHVAFWHDADKQIRRIYVNGEQKAEDIGKPLYEGASGDTAVGSWTETGQYFSGKIDEVRLWLKPLSEAEIRDTMQLLTPVEAKGKLSATWGNIKAQY